jgi:predicted NodU family carbamoyl transferase
MPSNGMNFSNMSHALGCDEHGRAAGKVMGMASYGDLLPNVYTQHAVAQMLELDSFRATCGTIQKAIDYLPDVKNIVLSGGYALNCTNNAKYLREFPDHQFFVDPIPHDGGTAVGAALHESKLSNEENK